METWNHNGRGISSNATTAATTTTTSSSSSSEDSASSPTTSSATVDAPVDLDGCCFVLAVADAHNTVVGDRSAPFCIADSAGPSAERAGSDGEAASGSGGDAVESTADSDATLEIVKFPSDQWEIGAAQEVRHPRTAVGCVE